MKRVRSKNHHGPSIVVMEPRTIHLPPSFVVPTRYGDLIITWDDRKNAFSMYHGVLETADFKILASIDYIKTDAMLHGRVFVTNNHVIGLSRLGRSGMDPGKGNGFTDYLDVRMVERDPGCVIEQMAKAVEDAIADSDDRGYDIDRWDEFDDAGPRSDFHRDSNRLPMPRSQRRK